MAKRTSTTTPSFTEPPMGGLRAMFARFTALVGSLVELTAAERDLGGYQGQDPALSAFTGAVDTARAQTLTHCAVLLAHETEDELAHGMQTVARMVRTVLTADKASEVAIIRNLISMRHETTLFPVFQPAHPRYNALLDRAFSALASYIALLGTGTAAIDRGQMAGLPEGTNVAHTHMSRNFTGLLADAVGIVLVRGPSIVSRAALAYGATVDDGTKIAAKISQLAAVGIVARDGV